MGEGPRSGAGVIGQRRTAADEVYEALKRDIISLRHRPGASLTEAGLAGAYGTSRVPVREACRRLQQESLVTAVPYKGYFVSQISLKEIRECFDLRRVLEVFAVERAVAHAPEEAIRQMEELAQTEYTYDDWESYGEFLERNLEFHLQLAALADNERLLMMLHDLLGNMQRFFFLGLDLGEYGREMRAEHEHLVELIHRRDREGAVACVEDQIVSSRERILRALMDGTYDLPLR